MTIEFKEDLKLTKEQLVNEGSKLIEFKSKVRALNKELEAYCTSKGYIFDDDMVIGSRNMDDAIELVQLQLGKMALDERMKK